MVKAMILFAFLFFFVSCSTYKPSPPPLPPLESLPLPSPRPLPDLTISDLSLDESGRLVVKISNIGEGPAPMGGGELLIFLGGRLKWRGSLEDLPDRGFLSPGGSTLYVTPVELLGREEVKVILSLEGEMADQDESNNVMSKVFEREVVPPSPPPLPDLAVTELFITLQKRLGVAIANLGEGVFQMEHGSLHLFVDGYLKEVFPLKDLSHQDFLPPQGRISLLLPVTLVGRHEVQALLFTSQEELNKGNNRLGKVLEILPSGPDIVVKDLELTEDLELLVILSNAGELDLRKGAKLRVQISVNGQRVSDFVHFTFAPLKAHFGNSYPFEPPYRISIAGISRVRVTILPIYSSDDIRLENNILEKTFMVFPFRMDGFGREAYSFVPSSQNMRQGEKIKVEMRWDGSEGPLMLFFQPPGEAKKGFTVSGRSPLKMEVPISTEMELKEKPWKVSITNLREKRIEGHLIIQHP